MEESHKRQAMLEKIKAELDNCSHPLFFFDDDPDGLSSFLLLYRYKNAGKGVVVKTYPVLDEKFMNAVKDYEPDKIFILDIPKVSEEFLKKLSVPIIYVDHHNIFQHSQENLIYFNPHIFDAKDERCVSYWCYRIISIGREEKAKEDMWIAMCGCVGDWFLPEFKEEFAKRYPALLDEKVVKPEDALFNSTLGKLVRIFSFILKGQHKEVMACVKILTRIASPQEILEESTSQGKFILNRFEKINQHYLELLNAAIKKKHNGEFISYYYTEKQWSFTSDLSNELLYRYPDKVIMVCREKSDEFKCSIRSNRFKLPERITKALDGLDGYGGGHDYACGSCVKSKDFEKFVESFKKELKSGK